MNFFKTDLAASPLEDLLKRWEATLPDSFAPIVSPTSTTTPASAPDSAAAPVSPPIPPTLDQFLAEEDILRECRSDNPRLIAYICTVSTLRQLVHRSFTVPAAIFAAEPVHDSRPVPRIPTSVIIPAQDDAKADAKERQLNFAYVASELLAADNKNIADAILEDHFVLPAVFSAVEDPDRGKLDTYVAVHFSKLVLSLLKMRNSRTIECIAKRGSKFINGILKHMDCAPIAELVVRMLDGPEPEHSTYGVQPNKRPAGEALDLLANADILGGLAECFVRASSDTAETAEGPAKDLRFAPDADDTESTESPDQREARQRRLREETMSHVTGTIIGLTERVLQLPDLNCIIPPKLSPYHTPVVVSRLLDAGLYASCNGKTDKEAADRAQCSESSEERVEAFSLRSNSALLHSLGLAADLMTTDANMVRDEDDVNAVPIGGPAAGPGGRQGVFGMGRPLYAGRGVGPSSVAKQPKERIQLPPPEDATPEELQLLGEHAKKKAGEAIVATAALEAELAIRFPRLSEMFGDSDELEETGRLRPLGSLRLKLAEFFAACMKKATQETVEQIIDLGVPKKLLELFSKYQWSSMLHHVVTKSIVAALEGEEIGRPARSAWFGAGLIPWLIESWSRNSKDEESAIRTRAGYMGHLIRIGTALKAYIEENQEEDDSDMPAQEELDKFKIFAEQTLAPAHNREATPLCGEQLDSGGSDDDEGEEATDVLDMGGITFVENLTHSTPSVPMQFGYRSVKQSDEDIDEEEEIRPVDVDDLDHFGADDDEVHELRPLTDHDIPAALREQLSKAEDAEAIKQIAEVSLEETTRNFEPTRVEVAEPAKPPPQLDDNPEPVDELKGFIDTVDSSSEDEGSYIAFVDDRKDEETATVSSGLEILRISEPDAETSLDGIVTEIEEPGPITPTGTPGDLLQSLAANIIAVPEDAGNSSDEEYEAWEDPARVAVTSNAVGGFGSTAEDSQKSESDRPRPVA